MALIYFYDATDTDKEQLTAGLTGTDHRWEYVASHITPGNCNPDTEVISVFISSTVSREVIHALPKLRLIACRSTGYNNIDLAAAQERGITVVNVPSYGEATVAEYTFALLLALQRKLRPILSNIFTDATAQDLQGSDLEDKTFGVIGTGHIGLRALRIAHGFGMKAIAYDAMPRPDMQEEYHFSYMGLSELLAQADVISLHAPYLPATHHLLGADQFAQMKQGAVLINTARGELVDTGALVEHLHNGHLGGAALDVIEGETLLRYPEQVALLGNAVPAEAAMRHSVEISALQKMPNVIVSPHNAFNTIEAIARINRTTTQNIIDFWYGNTPNKIITGSKPFGKLIIVRHAESEWNATGRWSGVRDVHLSPKGFKESGLFGLALQKLDLHVDRAFCSEQIRTRETLEGMLDAAQQFGVETTVTPALNERDYGDYTGKNKWDMKELIGEEAFDALRRGWDVPVPNGETLKMVYERVVPFYQQTVLPLLKDGKNVLIVAHGNSLRALIKYLDAINDADVAHLEMLFGQIVLYDITPEGLRGSSTTIKIDTSPPPA